MKDTYKLSIQTYYTYYNLSKHQTYHVIDLTDHRCNFPDTCTSLRLSSLITSHCCSVAHGQGAFVPLTTQTIRENTNTIVTGQKNSLPMAVYQRCTLICAPCDSELYGYAPASYNCASWVWVNTLHYQFTFLSIFLKRKLCFMFYYATKKLTRVRLHRWVFLIIKLCQTIFQVVQHRRKSLGLC